MPDTSEPASGSVKQKDANCGSAVKRPKNSCLMASDPPIRIGAEAKPLQEIEVPMPEHPQAISSSMMTPSM